MYGVVLCNHYPPYNGNTRGNHCTKRNGTTYINLYGQPSSGRNFGKAVDAIVLKLGYKNTPYDPKFFCKWIDGMPILVVFHSDDFRWCGPPHLLAEWDSLVVTFGASRYKVKDCTKESFVGINVTSER